MSKSQRQLRKPQQRRRPQQKRRKNLSLTVQRLRRLYRKSEKLGPRLAPLKIVLLANLISLLSRK
jgi:hypothetical protein